MQILLMIILGKIKGRRGQHFGGDFAMTCRCQLRLVGIKTLGGGGMLRLAVVVDTRPVLRAHIIALPHSLSGVMVFPKRFEKRGVSQYRRIKNNLYDFVVPSLTRADFAISRIRR